MSDPEKKIRVILLASLPKNPFWRRGSTQLAETKSLTAEMGELQPILVLNPYN
jgi:hypothetical protein